MPTSKQAKKHLGVIAILIKDRQMRAKEVQEILTARGHLIMARLGVNLQRACVENCTGLITIAVEGTAADIKSLVKEIDELYGIVCKYNILTE